MNTYQQINLIDGKSHPLPASYHCCLLDRGPNEKELATSCEQLRKKLRTDGNR